MNISFRGQIDPNTALKRALPHVVKTIEQDVNSEESLRKTACLFQHYDLITNIYPNVRKQAFNSSYSFTTGSLNGGLLAALSKKNRKAAVDKILGEKLVVDIAEKNTTKGIRISAKLLKYWKALPETIDSNFLSIIQEKFSLTEEALAKIKTAAQNSVNLNIPVRIILRNKGDKNRYIELAKEVIERVKSEGTKNAEKIICEIAQKVK